jgi:hypothetical protein
MPGRGELETLGASLEEILTRVTALIETGDSSASRDDEIDLVAIERGLAATLRKIRRLAARSAG